MTGRADVGSHFDDAETYLGEADTHPTGLDEAQREPLRLWLRLLVCTRLIETEIRKRLHTEFDMTLSRFDLMAQLERTEDGVLLGVLSRRLMVTNGNVTGLVDGLAREGLVTRVVEESDRRAARVRLTRKGRFAFGRMAAAHGAWLVELVGDLPIEQRELLWASLGELRGVVEKATAAE